MKKLKKLVKLTNLNSEQLKEKELGQALGGEIICFCGCFYARCGGSSSRMNAFYNEIEGFKSPLPKDDAECGSRT